VDSRCSSLMINGTTFYRSNALLVNRRAMSKRRRKCLTLIRVSQIIFAQYEHARTFLIRRFDIMPIRMRQRSSVIRDGGKGVATGNTGKHELVPPL